ncbi:Clr5 domain-containing protein [Geopyxis carbonaria]|nr:Clr5 domain-containing protein [Geopyxis carbonaria]
MATSALGLVHGSSSTPDPWEMAYSSPKILRRKDWEQHRDTIKNLYVTENRKLHDTRKLMAEVHGFYASEPKYKKKLREWKLEKKIPRRKMVAALKIEASRRTRGKETEFKFHDQIVTRKHLERSKQTYHTDLDEMEGLEDSVAPEVPSDMECTTPPDSTSTNLPPTQSAGSTAAPESPVEPPLASPMQESLEKPPSPIYINSRSTSPSHDIARLRSNELPSILNNPSLSFDLLRIENTDDLRRSRGWCYRILSDFKSYSQHPGFRKCVQSHINHLKEFDLFVESHGHPSRQIFASPDNVNSAKIWNAIRLIKPFASLPASAQQLYPCVSIMHPVTTDAGTGPRNSIPRKFKRTAYREEWEAARRYMDSIIVMDVQYCQQRHFAGDHNVRVVEFDPNIAPPSIDTQSAALRNSRNRPTPPVASARNDIAAPTKNKIVLPPLIHKIPDPLDRQLKLKTPELDLLKLHHDWIC